MARHVVVTGASGGIGRAVAIRMAKDGAQVAVLARRVREAEETVALCEAAGGHALALPCDVRVRATIDVAFDAACAAYGPIDAVVAVAGIGGPNADGPDDRFDEVVQTNLHGTYHTFRAAEPRLKSPGHLVAIASILGRFGVPGYTAYCASKAGVIGMVRAFALELAPKGVQVNAICPGWVETDMAWQGIDGMAAAMGVTRAEALAEAMKAVPTGRMGKPEEIAGVVAWLLGPDARGVVGQGIDVNGGAWMG